MTRTLRATFIAALVALAAGWLGLRSQNSRLEAELREASKPAPAQAHAAHAPARAPAPADADTREATP